MEYVPCNVCGSQASYPILVAEDVRYHVPGKFNIVRCQKCGLTFVSPRPTLSEIGKFYPSVVAEHIASSAPNPFALAEAQIVRDQCSQPGKILDVGCASGYFLSAMSQLGWEVYGIEPSSQAARKAREVKGAQIKVGMLQPDDYEDETFDVVTFWSVLEHLHDPMGALKIVRSILKPTGHLHVCVPNFNSLERYVFGAKWFGLDVPRHLYHFHPNILKKMLTENGFRIVDVQYSSGHDSLRSSLRLSKGQEWEANPAASASLSPTPPLQDRPFRSLKRAINRTAVNGITRFADGIGQGSQIIVHAQPAIEKAD